VEEELGDVLFAAAQLARFLDLDAETALRRANAKFVKRFTWVEQQLAADGLKPEPDHLARMETLWEQAKRVEIEEASDAG
jgi:ATP diphosphatase